MEYKYSGRTYSILLADDGLIECYDLGIKAPTAEDVKKAIREQVVKDKALPRINVFWFRKYGGRDLSTGTTSGKNAGSRNWKELWVSGTDEDGDPVREKKDADGVYLDTPENRATLDKYLAIKEQAHKLEEEADNLKASLVTVEVVE